jgi:hypothetical protein
MLFSSNGDYIELSNPAYTFFYVNYMTMTCHRTLETYRNKEKADKIIEKALERAKF